MSSKLKGKVIIVTGGGHGFGEAMAKQFAEEGAQVVIADINPKTGAKVESEINDSHGPKTALFQETNVTSQSSWEKLLEATLGAFDKVDVVINNAGTTYPKKESHTVTEEEFDKVINVNMKSIFMSVAVVVPYFMKQKAGSIVNISSVGGIRVKNGLVWYGGTKAFVNKITEGLASEYGHSGIRVNAICPILAYTDLAQSFMGVDDTPENRAKFEASFPRGEALKHNTSLGYVANAAVYLCSDDAAFVSGICMPIDGAATVYAAGVGK
ncbi:putative alcohol dehydrogenase [Exophiala viscosa]|uniref:putative alcohol dehydrogenase n=1 Tax=Exophiala viscosa TaxID=2486360 RepID=UPI00218F4708|nr:putative alcohol dehydrogenase [Exophiala viscosa]